MRSDICFIDFEDEIIPLHGRPRGIRKDLSGAIDALALNASSIVDSEAPGSPSISLAFASGPFQQELTMVYDAVWAEADPQTAASTDGLSVSSGAGDRETPVDEAASQLRPGQAYSRSSPASTVNSSLASDQVGRLNRLGWSWLEYTLTGPCGALISGKRERPRDLSEGSMSSHFGLLAVVEMHRLEPAINEMRSASDPDAFLDRVYDALIDMEEQQGAIGLDKASEAPRAGQDIDYAQIVAQVRAVQPGDNSEALMVEREIDFAHIVAQLLTFDGLVFRLAIDRQDTHEGDVLGTRLAGALTAALSSQRIRQRDEVRLKRVVIALSEAGMRLLPGLGVFGAARKLASDPDEVAARCVVGPLALERSLGRHAIGALIAAPIDVHAVPICFNGFVRHHGCLNRDPYSPDDMLLQQRDLTFDVPIENADDESLRRRARLLALRRCWEPFNLGDPIVIAATGARSKLAFLLNEHENFRAIFGEPRSNA